MCHPICCRVVMEVWEGQTREPLTFSPLNLPSSLFTSFSPVCQASFVSLLFPIQPTLSIPPSPPLLISTADLVERPTNEDWAALCHPEWLISDWTVSQNMTCDIQTLKFSWLVRWIQGNMESKLEKEQAWRCHLSFQELLMNSVCFKVSWWMDCNLCAV